MANTIIIAILAIIVGLAVFYIYKAKKNGKKCIGCPDSGCCGTKKTEPSCGCGCGCGCDADEEK